MKRKLLLFTMAGGMAYLTLSSNATGPAHFGNGIKTGGPGSSGQTCAAGGCHTGTTGNTFMQLNLIDKTNNVDTAVLNSRIFPGHTYKVTLGGGHSQPGVMNRWGFQVTATNPAGASIGDLAPSLTANVDDHMVGAIEVIEHTQGLSFTTPNIEFLWTAPTTLTKVTFHGILNATNGNGSVNGDKPSDPYSVTYTNASLSVPELSSNIKIVAFPNPAKENFSLKFDNADAGTYTVSIYDMTGKKLHSENMNVQHSATMSIKATGWASGMYMAHINKDGAQRVLPVVIQ